MADRKRNWHDRAVNVAASILVVFSWKLAAWGCTFIPWVHATQDQLFMWIIAGMVALNLPSKKNTI